MTNFESYFENYDPSYQLAYQASWQSWEEDGWIFIFQKGTEYFSIEGGYCVMVEDHSLQDFKIGLEGPLTEDQILEIMIQWDDIEDEIELW